MQARGTEMTKTVRARYTLEFKQEAMRLVARSSGFVDQALCNRAKADRLGELKGVDTKAINAEQMEISRLRAELARAKRERNILGTAPTVVRAHGKSCGHGASGWARSWSRSSCIRTASGPKPSAASRSRPIATTTCPSRRTGWMCVPQTIGRAASRHSGAPSGH